MPDAIPPTKPPAARWTSVVLAALCVWLGGFALGRWSGCDPGTARIRACSFLLSWLLGWVAMKLTGDPAGAGICFT